MQETTTKKVILTFKRGLVYDLQLVEYDIDCKLVLLSIFFFHVDIPEGNYFDMSIMS